MDRNKAKLIVETMMQNDEFSQWLGIEVIEIHPGFCKLSMTVRKEMVNGFGIAHGGITYSFADSALAFAANSRNQKAVSITTSIEHLQPLKVGDVLEARAKEVQHTNRTGQYTVEIVRKDGLLVATFKGTVYRRSEVWF